MLFVLLSLTACKKDAITVDQEKVFVQSNASKPTDPILGTSMNLTLKPGGKANILPGGDIVYQATYKIKGDKIEVKAEMINQKFKFTVISESELHGEHGEILTLLD